MIQRLISPWVQKRLRAFPAVALLGPRQSGKTTLAKKISSVYYDLEQPEEQLRLDLDWDRLIRSNALIALDEAQAMPGIFPRIRGAIDARRKKNGRFLLLGSVAPSLMKNVSESLAGRLAICELSPILLAELKRDAGVADAWLRGGFPDGGILKKNQYPRWQNDYLALLAQRDLPAWGLSAKPQLTLRLFKMLAASHGQLWNASHISASLGISYHTVNHHLDYLENAYLILILKPYFPNTRKRLVKSPKVYWKDSGLLHSLMGVRSAKHLLEQPWAGASWEGWVINQIVSTLQALGEVFEAHFFRTSDGHEIDLVIDFSKGRWAFEIKLTSAPSSRDMERLNAAADLIHADKRLLISQNRTVFSNGRATSANIRHCLELIKS